jgi:hypothetical protein
VLAALILNIAVEEPILSGVEGKPAVVFLYTSKKFALRDGRVTGYQKGYSFN